MRHSSASLCAIVFLPLLHALSLSSLAHLTVMVMHRIVGIFNRNSLSGMSECMYANVNVLLVKFAHQKVLLCIIFLQIGQIYGKLSTIVFQPNRTHTNYSYHCSLHSYNKTYCVSVQ